MLLEDFNYFFNKAINQYINKRYNIYDINQQTTDDLRVLKSTCILSPNKASSSTYDDVVGSNSGSTVIAPSVALGNLYGACYEVTLPPDYLHILNCICIYQLNKTYKCYDKGSFVQFAATKLSADAWSQIINDYYHRPTPQRPYFYIHNVNTSDSSDSNQNYYLPTNPYSRSNPHTLGQGTDMPDGAYEVNVSGSDGIQNNSSDNSNLARYITIGSTNVSLIEKPIAVRVSNPSTVRLEIRYGKDDTVFELKQVLIDYIKSPQHIRLTQEQLDLTEDTSQIMEFPDYVCQEIINELVTLVMENTADQRLQTHNAVTQTIANPAQQQAQTPAQG